MLRDVEGAEDVDREHVREDRLVVVLDRRHVAEDAGVGERDVELAHQRHGVGHGGGVGDVGHGGLHPELVRERVEAVGVDVREDHPRALGDEAPRGRRADAARGAGDERGLVLESAHGKHLTIKLHRI